MGKLNLVPADTFPNMLYCANSMCSHPFNQDGNKFCIKCGQILSPLLRNRFRVVKLLGEGGFGKTYAAVDVDKMDEPCVIKQFLPQVQGTAALEKATELFKQEAKRLYDLGEHPQIPRLIAYFEQDRRLYLVQELIAGQNLLQELQRQGIFSEDKITQLLADLLPVLQFIHERGVIHRDIKPENIMRRQDGKLMLIDFGVSKQATGTILGQVGTTVGTPGYTPIEQMRGQVFPASDLYSLGVTCIRLLTGYLPREDGYDELYDALSGEWRWRKYLSQQKGISEKLGQILDKLIQAYVKERYQLAHEVVSDINDNKTQRAPKSKIVYKHHIPFPSHNPFSLVTVDYENLKHLLAYGRWQDANEETFDILLKIARREKEGSLYMDDIKKIPCQELQIIDNIWIKYSHEKFGLSVQRKIWLSIKGKKEPNSEVWQRFGYEVGWLCPQVSRKKLLFHADLFYEEIPPVWFDNLIFSIDAPKGHLPCFKSIGLKSFTDLILLPF